MPNINLGQVSKQSQIQTQRISLVQLQTLNLLAMGTQNLREEILKEVENNPALEVVRDPFSDGLLNIKKGEYSSVHTGFVSKTGLASSDSYQQILESVEDNTETLQEHLLHELNMQNITSEEFDLCTSIIGNLDSNGYFILAPISLLDKTKSFHNQEFLDKCLNIVQHFDPAGICVQNVSESLELQAKLNSNCPKLALYILHGHLDFIQPPIAEKTRKKIINYIQEQSKLSFRIPEPNEPERKDLSIEAIEESIHFIQSLNPYPACNFLSNQSTRFIRPDVYVTRNIGELEKENPENGLIFNDKNSYFRIIPANDTVPLVQVSKDFNDSNNLNIQDKESNKFVKVQLKSAESFVETLNFRQMIIIRACSMLVKAQKDFFNFGPGKLVPLTQKKFAEMLNVHESTVSRFADSKFIHCDWGTFPIKYFFSTAIQKSVSTENLKDFAAGEDIQTQVSSDTVRLEIKKILSEQKPGDKKISDQKLADMLAAKGYKIARRTVAKYRAQLNIASSFER